MNKNFKTDTEKHEILKQAAIYSYRKEGKIPDGYRLIKQSAPSSTGFYACALKKENEIIIAFRGTDNLPEDAKYNYADIAMKKFPQQYPEAKDFCAEVLSENRGCNIYATGHSLGGTLAQTTGAYFDLKTATFNPAGLGSVIRNGNLRGYEENIVNYHNAHDILRHGFVYDNIGTSYTVESIDGTKFIGHHELENMKPLSTAKIDTKDSHKTMGEHLMDYNNRWNPDYDRIKGKLNQQCPGSYQVSGYTRGDGTEVGGYTRTCGFH